MFIVTSVTIEENYFEYEFSTLNLNLIRTDIEIIILKSIFIMCLLLCA